MTTGFQKQQFCRDCGRQTLHVKANIEQNKTLTQGMACLTVLTCGLALPFVLVWAIIHGWQVGAQKFHCQVCGRAN